MKSRGDAAVIEYTNRFDRLSAKCMAELELSRAELEAALAGLPADRRAALSKPPPPAFAAITSASRCRAGGTRKKVACAAPCSARRSPRSTASASMCRAARRPTVIGADERHPGARRRCRRTDHGRADAGWRAQTRWCWPPPHRRRQSRLLHRRARRPSGALAYGTQTVRRSTRSSARATPTWPPPSAASSASSASTWSPAPRDSRRLRWHDRPRLGGDGPLFAGRAR